MATQILGLDIGGANLKAAHSNGTARTIPFPLWKHPERLSAELASLCASMPAYELVAVTMTGELCDCFETKREGVRAILNSVSGIAPSTLIRVWCVPGCFRDFDDAMNHADRVAAANWLALAHLVAQKFPDERVLLIDSGSTTTDIVYLNHSVPEPRGFTDSERLATGELVYTGVRRTPICAVLGMAVAAEFFATMLDAYLCVGLVPENPNDRDTADGRPATRAHARARLARMVCADADTFSQEQAQALAESALRIQHHVVGQAINRVVETGGHVDRIVVSGSGEILGRSVGAKHRLTSLTELLGRELSEAACAYAVAILAAREQPDAR